MELALGGECFRPWFFCFRAVKGVLASNQKMIEDVPINLPVLERAGPAVASFLDGVEGKGMEEGGETGELSSGGGVTGTSLWIREGGF